MARSTISLDFRANTAKAMASFRSFSDDLTKKFLISGLKLDAMKNAINEINREFDNALGNQGMKSAMELKQLESSAGAVFAALKGGSLEAGREMAKNIRVALGDVSKSIGSTGEDINAVMRMIPVTAQNVLTAFGVSMEDFAKMNLRMVTNARDAFGEDAGKLIEGILAGDVGIQQLNNDRTGIGQLIRTRMPGMDFASMSAEGRTAAVLQLMQDEEFQSAIEGIAEDNAGFRRTVASFKNVLFDPRTGIFGILKEVTLELKDFDGNTIEETTSIFKEVNRLFGALFSPEDGLFAVIGRALGSALGLGEDGIVEVIVRVIRWMTNFINSIKELFVFEGDFQISFDFEGIIKGLNNIITGVTSFLVNGMQSIQEYFNNLSFDGEGILSTLGTLFTNIFTSVKLLFVEGFRTITAVLGSLIRNFGGWENIGKFIMEMIDSLRENVMDIVQAFFDMLMSDDLDLAGFIDVGLDVLSHFADALVDVIELVIANFSQLKDKLFPDGFERIGRELGKIASRLIPVVVELFAEVMTPIREVIRGFFMELIEHFFGVTENISRPIADFLTNFVLMADPGGIISGILGKIPLFGDTLVGIYKFINYITDTLGGLLGDLLPWGQKIAGTAISNQLQDVTYNAAENIEQNEDISGGDYPGEFAKELLKKGSDLTRLPTNAARTIIKEKTGLPDWLVDGIPLPFYSGNIPQIARASRGMNIKSVLAEEIAQTRPGIRPVIANSDEIIIPPGRLNEIRLVSTEQIINRVALPINTLFNIVNNKQREEEKVKEKEEIILNTPQESFNINAFEGLFRLLGDAISSLGGSFASILGEVTGVDFTEIIVFLGDQFKLIKEGFKKSLEDIFLTEDNEDLNSNLISLYDEIISEIEDVWIPGLEFINEFFDHLDKSIKKWRLELDRLSIEVGKLQLPQLTLPSIDIPELKVENIDIDPTLGDKIKTQWDNVYEFFSKAGTQAKELSASWGEGTWNWLKNLGSNLRPGSGDNTDSGSGQNRFLGNVSLTALSRERSLSAPSSSIIIANGEEIVAPSTMLVSLAEILHEKVSNDTKQESVINSSIINTFTEKINNITNAKDINNHLIENSRRELLTKMINPSSDLNQNNNNNVVNNEFIITINTQGTDAKEIARQVRAELNEEYSRLTTNIIVPTA